MRRGLHPPKQTAGGPYTIRPTGSGGLRPGVDLSSNAAVAEVIDEGASVDALR